MREVRIGRLAFPPRGAVGTWPDNIPRDDSITLMPAEMDQVGRFVIRRVLEARRHFRSSPSGIDATLRFYTKRLSMLAWRLRSAEMKFAKHPFVRLPMWILISGALDLIYIAERKVLLFVMSAISELVSMLEREIVHTEEIQRKKRAAVEAGRSGGRKAIKKPRILEIHVARPDAKPWQIVSWLDAEGIEVNTRYVERVIESAKK